MKRKILWLTAAVLLVLSCKTINRAFETVPPPENIYDEPIAPTASPVQPTAEEAPSEEAPQDEREGTSLDSPNNPGSDDQVGLDNSESPDDPPPPEAPIFAIYIPDAAPDSLDNTDRTSLNGSLELAQTAHFRFHYTTEGRNAVPAGDADGDGIPDYVESVAQAFEYSWHIEITVMGWAAPPPDDGLGGNDLYDVYFEDIYDDGTAGYTEGGITAGDNPNTPVIEPDSSASFISMDNDYEEYDDYGDPSILVKDFIDATAAHEFNHAIQYGYDGYESADWLWEATATWAEERVYDHVNDAHYYLDSVFKSPDSCQITEGGYERVEDDLHWYGMYIFFEYLSERHGDEIVRSIWEFAVNEDGYAAIESALEPTGQSLEEIFKRFAVAMLLRDFEEGAEFPTVRLEGYAERQGDFYPDDGVGQMGVDFVEITTPGLIDISITGLSEFLLVGLSGQMADIYEPQSGTVRVDVDQYDHLYLLVINLETARFEHQCEMADYSVLITPAGSTDSPARSHNAPEFSAPRFEALLDPDDWE
jgi:hypothetical protein